MNMDKEPLILSDEELDQFIKGLEISELENVGSLEWFQARDKVVKLYQMAMLQARSGEQETIVESVIKNEKGKYLVAEVIVVGLWREQVFPELVKLEPDPVHTFPTYLVLYHEGMILGLLQILLYHRPMTVSLEDSAKELAEYAVLHIACLNPEDDPLTSDDVHEKGKESTIASIKLQQRQISDALAAQSLAILRHIVDAANDLPVGISRYLYHDADVPSLIADRLMDGTWARHKGRVLWKYHDSTWRPWRPGDPALSSTECQAWLLLFQLLAGSQTCQYELTTARRERLSKVAGLLHDGVVDMLSPLKDLKYLLNSMSLSSEPTRRHPDPPIIVDMSTSLREVLAQKHAGQFKSFAGKASKLLFYGDDVYIRKLAVTMANQFSHIDQVTDALRTCHNCYMKATKKCSRCKTTWYCSVQCQRDHWPAHKPVCG